MTFGLVLIAPSNDVEIGESSKVLNECKTIMNTIKARWCNSNTPPIPCQLYLGC